MCAEGQSPSRCLMLILTPIAKFEPSWPGDSDCRGLTWTTGYLGSKFFLEKTECIFAFALIGILCTVEYITQLHGDGFILSSWASHINTEKH